MKDYTVRFAAVSPHDKQRLHSLDALRGFAAVVIAFFWHYIHFLPACLFCHRDIFPFYRPFQWFYDYGQGLVDFFFVLSGFVLMHAYGNRISEGRISFYEYFVRRMSRLYPLHFVTLCVVAVEVVWMKSYGQSFIYQNNDIFHFVLNALLLQAAWLDTTLTFNGPSWSIATEVVAYILFFAIIANLKNRFHVNVAFLACAYVGMALLYKWADYLVFNHLIGRALLGFFVGCIAYQLAPLVSLPNRRASVTFQVVFPIAFVGLFVSAKQFGFEQLFGRYDIVLPLVVYPASIVFVINNQIVSRFLSMAPFRVLGDSSYSIYLWHYPVQTMLFWIYGYFGLAPQTHLAWFIYFLSVMTVAIVSHYWFEKPAQGRIRAIFANDRGRAGTVKLEPRPAGRYETEMSASSN